MIRTRSVAALLLLVAGPVCAEQVSILRAAAFSGQRSAMFEFSRPAPAAGGPVRLASLFANRDAASLFAPYPQRASPAAGPQQHRATPDHIQRLLHLIAQAEAGPQGYDAVQHGAVRLPAKAPTEMTIAEILAWIERTPGQNHAIGRYQFIPATLRRLVKRLGVGADTVFAPPLQDRLAGLLLAEAGLDAFRDGMIGRHAFMHNLARIWAGLPTSTGASHYDGYAGNRATMTWARFDAEMSRIFPG